MTARGTVDSPGNPLRAPMRDPILCARGLAVIRLFFGLIVFAHGLAKLEPALAKIDLGP